MFIIKLGGSVITDKREKNTFKKEIALRLVKEIRESKKRTVIVHGAGSFGHILAKKYELHKGFQNPKQIAAVSEVQKDVKELNMMVLGTFWEQGISVVSLAPSAFLTNENGNLKSMNSDIFKRYFDLGITPITFGDVVLDEALKFSICSGDQIMLELARTFRPEKIIFVTDVDGVYSSDPHFDKKAELLPIVNKETIFSLRKSESKVDDVTGSIFGKLDIMMDIALLGHKTVIINGTVENRLKEALTGNEVICTRVVANL